MKNLYSVKLRIILFGFIMLFCSAISNAQDKKVTETQLTAEGQKAFQNLLTAETFEDTYVGESGSLSDFVKAYRVLLEEEKRAEAFRFLLKNCDCRKALCVMRFI